MLACLIFFGLIELSFGDSVWNYFNILEYWNANPTGVERFDNLRHSGHMYSSDLIYITGEKVRRMVSVFLEPTHFAAFLLTIFNIQLIIFRKYFSSILIFIFGVLTFSKFFVIGAILSIGVFLKGRASLTLHMMLFIVVAAISIFTYAYVGLAFGFLSHLIGFATGLELLLDYPFGIGVGVGGNRGQEGWSSESGSFGGESGLGNIFSQVGIIGFVHLYILLKIAREFDSLFKSSNNRLFLLAGSLLFCYMLNFYWSASSLGTSGAIFTFILLGIIHGQKYFIIRYPARKSL